jgi:hypothetical protein
MFSDLGISTTTVTIKLNMTSFKHGNIIDLAKYLPLDDFIIGIKLVYAGGDSIIIRGLAKLSKKKKDFLNQVTITLKNTVNIVSCKIFHNGTVHLTGTKNLDESRYIFNKLFYIIKHFNGKKIMDIQDEFPFLCTFDNLLYTTNGDYIGWKKNGNIYICNSGTCVSGGEYVVVSPQNNTDKTKTSTFISIDWNQNIKWLYDLNGCVVGSKELELKNKYLRKYYKILNGYVYYKNEIVGKEILKWLDTPRSSPTTTITPTITPTITTPTTTTTNRTLLKGFSYDNINCNVSTDEFTIHMINAFFKASFSISKTKLHEKLIQDGYYSRYDSCLSSSVNLRFHYRKDMEKMGICKFDNKATCCCKVVSISFFGSGKINITGLSTFEQGPIVYNFICDLFTKYKEDISTFQV